LLSADILLQALEYIAKHEAQLQLMDTFPIAAVDGTLTGRGSLIHEPLDEKFNCQNRRPQRGI
ncbi:D-alanyl-D-alanine carboxypeptidase/endopeptidase, partial [Pasteurella multocida subsp. multocida str. Anand1_cattle]